MSDPERDWAAECPPDRAVTAPSQGGFRDGIGLVVDRIPVGIFSREHAHVARRCAELINRHGLAEVVTYCNSCIDAMDPRHAEFEGCVAGEIYGECGDENCGGICEHVGSCLCVCHVGETDPK